MTCPFTHETAASAGSRGGARNTEAKRRALATLGLVYGTAFKANKLSELARNLNTN